MATTRATGSPVFVAIPEAIGTSAAVVPTDVPMLSDTKHEAAKSPTNTRCAGNSDSVMFTAASIAPMSFAVCAKAPAIMNIHSIIIRFSCPAPDEKILILSDMLRRFKVNIAYIDEIVKTTESDTL